MYEIVLAFDQIEGEEFATWLREQGHAVTIGSGDGSAVDGDLTSYDDDANEIMRRLWDGYCNGPIE